MYIEAVGYFRKEQLKDEKEELGRINYEWFIAVV